MDVLRFTTAVDVAVGNGARVYPYRWRDDGAQVLAERVGAEVADGRGPDGWSLSPAKMRDVPVGSALVLPSPNGSTCAALAAEQGAHVVAASLRNATAVAAWLNARDASVLVVACGERWPDGSLRPALEDQLGAAAVIHALDGECSAEAAAWARLREAVADDVGELVRGSASGREALARGWSTDLELATQVDASTSVPLLTDGAFSAAF